ncbi:hypothetical protein F4604DRAFT_1936880 [Suillus subluteus]|nr:hypothetical protein F4604DRAFT_1936880 [Suillus subluteus]
MSTTPPESVQHFPGLCGLLPSVSASSLEMDNIAEDVTAEQETLLQSTLMDASKGVTEGTDSEYKRLMNQAVVFLTGVHLLRKDEVKAGEVANSAHAITTVSSFWPPKPSILLKLYHHNHLDETWAIHPYQPGERLSSHHWGGGRARRLLQAAYTLAVFEKGVTLHLPFCKTHQSGDIKPFHLWVFPLHEAHICPVRALTAWLGELRIESGYVFRKIASGDRVVEANTPMASEQFLELFRNNLLDIGIDPAPYGTHSF